MLITNSGDTDECYVQLFRRIALPFGLCVATFLAFASAKLGPNAGSMLPIMTALMISALFSSIAGFAFSAIAGATIYHLVPSPVEAVTIMMYSSIAIQLYSVISMWRSIEWCRLMPFILGGFLAIAPFSWLILRLSAGSYLVVIGIFLVMYGVYMLFRKPLTIQVGARTGLALDIFVGALGGVTGPLAAFPGGAITIWCGMRDWDKVRQRAIFQPYILIMQVAALVLITSMKGGSHLDTQKVLYAIPALLGCYFGLLLFQRLSNQHFNRIVNALLIVSGMSMIMKQFQLP